jgi:hypothetical protein
MRGGFDFSSWQAVLSTLLGLALFSLVVVGIRLLVMHTVQLRRERENRQINERLRTLIAAYKVLGGSFTGNLAVDPAHLRDRRREDPSITAAVAGEAPGRTADEAEPPGSERRRRIRDAVEAALSDVILLGTEEQVRLAARAASDMVAGRAIETADLVVSLRSFIRDVLDLEAVPADGIPRQGPARPASGAGRGGREAGSREGRRQGGGRGAGAAGGGMGSGTAGGAMHHDDDADSTSHG